MIFRYYLTPGDAIWICIIAAIVSLVIIFLLLLFQGGKDGGSYKPSFKKRYRYLPRSDDTPQDTSNSVNYLPDISQVYQNEYRSREGPIILLIESISFHLHFFFIDLGHFMLKFFIVFVKIIFFPMTIAIIIYQHIDFHRLYGFFIDLRYFMKKFSFYMFKIVFFPVFILKAIYQKYKSYQNYKKNSWKLFEDKINEDIRNYIWKLSEPENQFYNGLIDLKYLKVKIMEYKSKRVLYFFGNYVDNSEFDALLKKIEKTERFYPICKKILKINEIYSKKIPANNSDKELLPIEEKYLIFLREIGGIFYRNGFNISNFSGIMTLKSKIDKRLQKIRNLICNKPKMDFIENDIGMYFPDTNFFRSLHDYSFDYRSLKEKWDFLIENNYEMRKIDKSDLKNYLKNGKIEKIEYNFKYLKNKKILKNYMHNVNVLLFNGKGRRKLL